MIHLPQNIFPYVKYYKSQYPVKESVGVAICRVNNISKKPELLVVHKRYTYAFADFLHGRYSGNNLNYIKTLFTSMTIEELLDVYSLNFTQMWKRVWLKNKDEEFFNKKNAKFQRTFMSDGGVNLRQLLASIRCIGALWWEIPKGKRNNLNESDLNCAVRETNEETGIPKHYYHILTNSRRVYSHINMNIKYVSIFYTAITVNNYYKLTDNLAIDKIDEVSETAWMSLEELKILDKTRNITGSYTLSQIARKSFKVLKKYLKGTF